jgi:hypothetical protein
MSDCEEEFEDTKGVISSRKSKDKQHNYHVYKLHISIHHTQNFLTTLIGLLKITVIIVTVILATHLDTGVKPKTINLVFVASPLSTLHY